MLPPHDPPQPSRNPAELPHNLTDFLGRTWWVYLLGGIAAIAFAILALINPSMALLMLAIYFAIYLLVDGAFSVLGALTHRDRPGWGLVLIYGLLGVLIGLWLLLNPPASVLLLVYAVAFFMVAAGLTQVLFGIKIRNEIKGEWVLYLSGVLSILWCALIFFQVGIGSITVAYLITFWALLFGILRVIFALRARNFAKSLRAHP